MVSIGTGNIKMKSIYKIALLTAGAIALLNKVKGIGVVPGWRKAQKIKIENTKHDRRQKLNDEDKQKMRELRARFGYSYNQLADMFGVSKRLAIFVCNPNIYERAKKMFAERHASGRYDPTKEEWAAIMREHRNYKAGLYFRGEIH